MGLTLKSDFGLMVRFQFVCVVVRFDFRVEFESEYKVSGLKPDLWD